MMTKATLLSLFAADLEKRFGVVHLERTYLQYSSPVYPEINFDVGVVDGEQLFLGFYMDSYPFSNEILDASLSVTSTICLVVRSEHDLFQFAKRIVFEWINGRRKDGRSTDSFTIRFYCLEWTRKTRRPYDEIKF